MIVASSCNKTDVIRDFETGPFRIEDEFERLTFRKISEIAEEASMVWSGYDYLYNQPIYLIFTDAAGAFTNGYLINPPLFNLPSGAEEVNNQDASGLKVYYYEAGLAIAAQQMGESAFFAQINLANTTYFTYRQHHQTDIFYLNYKNQGNNNIPLALTHELFHLFQFGPGQFKIDNYIQDRNNYPLDEASITTHLLLSELMAQAYAIDQPSVQASYLDYFAAMVNELLKNDVSDQQLVRNYALNASMVEGSARYVEVFAAQSTIFPDINADPTHGWYAEVQTTDDPDLIRSYLAFRMWYHVGAIAVKILIDQGIDVAEGFRNGQTPYDQILAHMNYTEQELAVLRETARTLVDMEAIRAEASRLFQLLQ